MEISLSTFKQLLHSLKEKEISLKVRTHTGWSNSYLFIIGFIASMSDQQNKTFGGVVLSNLNETEGIIINNISNITAFELDAPCDDIQAKMVYHLSDNRSLKPLIID